MYPMLYHSGQPDAGSSNYEKFNLSQLVCDGWTNGRTNEPTDGRASGPADGRPGTEGRAKIEILSLTRSNRP